MLGAIIGDIIGSSYEFNPTKRMDFELLTADSSFTDDTVCTVAVADAILNGKSYHNALQEWCRKYPHPCGGYGISFRQWVFSDNPQPYGSYGNGSAMRVSAVGWLFDDLQTVLDEAKKSAECTHNHPEGIKGAQAVAACIFLLRQGQNKAQIKEYVEQTFGYHLNFTIDEIREDYRFNETCQGTVPQAIVCYLDSTDFENCIRLAVSLGGDADTLAAIAGSIAEADKNYKINAEFADLCISKLPADIQCIVNKFNSKINIDVTKEVAEKNHTKKYHLHWLIEKYKKGDNLDYIFFWGHRNDKPFITKACLSQWYKIDIEEAGVIYKSAEHYMMAHKALLFNDKKAYDLVLSTKTPEEAKKEGRKVRNFVESVWEQHCFDIVVRGNYLKFSQNDDLKDFLLNTDDKILVEASPYDKIWGIGLSVQDDMQRLKNPCLWDGKNLLGFALMEVR